MNTTRVYVTFCVYLFLGWQKDRQKHARASRLLKLRSTLAGLGRTIFFSLCFNWYLGLCLHEAQVVVSAKVTSTRGFKKSYSFYGTQILISITELIETTFCNIFCSITPKNFAERPIMRCLCIHLKLRHMMCRTVGPEVKIYFFLFTKLSLSRPN